jgi:hypothetical protein
MSPQTDTAALRAIMALPLLPGVGLRHAKELIRHYGSAQAAI